MSDNTDVLVKLAPYLDNKNERRYVAARDIGAEQCIITERKPLLAFPSFSLNSPVPTCLNCYVKLNTAMDSKQCKQCGLYLCHICEKHGSECELTLEYRKSTISSGEIYMKLWPRSDETTKMLYLYTTTIMVLRALALQKNDNDAYKKLFELKKNSAETECRRAYSLMGYEEVTASITAFVGEKASSEADIMTIIKIATINNYKIGLKEYEHSAVFYKISFVENSCKPNCIIFTATSDGRAYIKTAQSIKKGDSVSILSIHYGWTGSGTGDRINTLTPSLMFACRCEECRDPRQYKKMNKAIKCTSDRCTGSMIPSTLVVLHGEETSNFACERCKLTKTSVEIDQLIEDISQKYMKVQSSKESTELTKFIKEHSKILHENHFMIIKAELLLVKLFNHESASVKDLKENVERCEKLTEWLKILQPDDSEQRESVQLKALLCKSALYQ